MSLRSDELPRDAVAPPDDLAKQIFSADSGNPLAEVPDVVAVPVRRAVDDSSGPDYAAAGPVVQRHEPGQLDHLELRYKPGRRGSGTREWLPRSYALQGTGSMAGATGYPFSRPSAASVCDTVYHGAATDADPLPNLLVEEPSSSGWAPKIVSYCDWYDNRVVADFSGPTGTVKRSTGVVTNLLMTDVAIRDNYRSRWDAETGPRKSKSKFTSSRFFVRPSFRSRVQGSGSSRKGRLVFWSPLRVPGSSRRASRTYARHPRLRVEPWCS
jgi:hypothetical protein